MACPLLWHGRPPNTGNKYTALRRRLRKTGADNLFTVCHCHLSRRILSDSSFYSEIKKYATRILVCGIAVSKSQEFLLKVRRLFIFCSTTTQGIRLRRRVDVFSTTSYTSDGVNFINHAKLQQSVAIAGHQHQNDACTIS